MLPPTEAMPSQKLFTSPTLFSIRLCVEHLSDSIKRENWSQRSGLLCLARISSYKIAVFIGVSSKNQFNPPQFFTALLPFSLTVSLTVPVRFIVAIFMVLSRQNIRRIKRAILGARVGRMSAERVKLAARMLPDAAPLIPVKAQRPKHLCQHRLSCR